MQSFLRTFFLTTFLGIILTSGAWGSDASLFSKEKTQDGPQEVKTEWQAMSENDVQEKNAHWDFMNHQFQENHPPYSKQ